jgi:hypothetical protein
MRTLKRTKARLEQLPRPALAALRKFRALSRSLSLLGLLIAAILLTACAGSPRRSSRGDFRYTDTETAGRLRHAAAAGEAATTGAPAASGALASQLARLVPALLAVLEDDNAVGELEDQLVECARKAEREVNASSFGGRSPTRQDCSEVVGVDPCGNSITRAMQLGQQKHFLALQCAEEVLQQLWPAPFSIEQRYRYYPHAGLAPIWWTRGLCCQLSR